MPNADYHKRFNEDAETQLRRMVRERDERIEELRRENWDLRARLGEADQAQAPVLPMRRRG